MKTKHNKKRNTAFLYEALIRQLTKCVVNKNVEEKKKIISLIKEFFGKDCILKEELSLYNELSEDNELDPILTEKFVQRVYSTFEKMDKNEIFQEQSKLISKINKTIEGSPLANFVPNYKSLATVYQFLNSKNHKHRIMLEKQLVDQLTSPKEEKKELKPLTNLEFKCFVERFNKEYTNELLNEQKVLLKKYISSFNDNQLELKVYLNEEIGRLKEQLNKSLIIKEISSDEEMINKTKEVINLVEDFKNRPIDVQMLEDVLMVQTLVNEIESKEE